MKFLSAPLILLLFVSSTWKSDLKNDYSQNNVLGPETKWKEEDVVGTYWTPKKDGKIRIYKKTDGKYYGKIEDGNDKERLDAKNPDKSKRSQKVVGMEFMKGFSFDGDDEWTGGKIYDPDSGNTYDCYMWLSDDKKLLKVKGYIGISLLGRSETFERVN